MYFLMYIATAVIVYVYSFNKDFNAEDVGKALPFIIICCILVFVAGILSSL